MQSIQLTISANNINCKRAENENRKEKIDSLKPPP